MSKAGNNPLRYTGGRRNNRTAKAHFLRWRKLQSPPIPVRCDNELCRFHEETLVWNGKVLPLILEHRNGVNSDNRPQNLRLLCPNCDAQNGATRGGANKGRVLKSSGGFCIVGDDGSKSYFLPVEPAELVIQGFAPCLEVKKVEGR